MLLQSNRFADPSRLSVIHELERDTLSNPQPIKKTAPPFDLEVKDAQLIFNSVWKELEEAHGRVNLRFPVN